ncbi:MAG: hypothetical protein QOG79_1907, partial [Mycobacterium sp.]|nr:hypothetical protein [Mycobacterium sp.]
MSVVTEAVDAGRSLLRANRSRA